jgi:signal transduction histidine kinase
MADTHTNLPNLPALRHSLSAKLLVFTVLFAMVAEVLIFTPSIARFRVDYLEEKIGSAHIAALALEAAPTHMLSPQLEIELLQYVDAYSVALDMHGNARMLVMNRDMPPVIDKTYDLRKATFFSLIANAFSTLTQTQNRVLRVMGPSPKNPGILVDLVIDEGPLRRAMYAFAWRMLSLSMVISLITAVLLYFSLQWLLVQPMRRITEAMHQFRTAPEDESSMISPSQRRDEIGVAQRELQRMQSDLRLALHAKTRLAELGAAVTKVTHDLRNILSTAQLVSDRLTDSNDPTVKRVTPTLIASLDRAISLCVNTLRFAREERPSVEMARFSLGLLVEDVGATLRLPLPESSRWTNEVPRDFWIRADRDQMFRVLLNLGRNAYEAGAARVAVSVVRNGEGLTLAISDNGQGIAVAAREKLFQPFAGTAKSGGTGLGLAISRELMRAHGGDIWLAESGPGLTRFELTLPERCAVAEADVRRAV